MSVTNPDGEKVFLPRSPASFLELAQEYAGKDAARWKSLAFLFLHARGCSMSMIGRTFNVNKSTV